MSRKWKLVSLALVIFIIITITLTLLILGSQYQRIMDGKAEAQQQPTQFSAVGSRRREPQATNAALPAQEVAVEPTAVPKIYEPTSYPSRRQVTPQPNNTLVVPICQGAPKTRLMGKTQGRSTSNGNPLRIRQNPGKSGKFLGNLANGEYFSILEGPECLDKMVWWKIQTTTLTGWIAEGQGAAYYIEPFR